MMKTSAWIRLCLSMVLGVSASAARAIQIDTVPIGNPGNAGDAGNVQTAGTIGAVPYNFRMGKTEVTNGQYSAFLNAVAKSDPHVLYETDMAIIRSGIPGNYSYAPGMNLPPFIRPPAGGYDYANKPVDNINWYDAIRFTNWLNNGQGNSDTETGAYTILGGGSVPTNFNSIVRNPGAKWFLPNEDEWYKAAYFDGAQNIYYKYPTGTNVTPNNNVPAADTGNSANFNHSSDAYPFQFTDVGAYSLSKSPYGTLDQGGNAAEWIESPAACCITPGAGSRIYRGGMWMDTDFYISALPQSTLGGTFTNILIGFRVATVVPEPKSWVLMVTALVLAVPIGPHRRGRASRQTTE
jgi:formylglycine-generating enzyme